MFPLFSNKKEGVRSIILDIQSGLVRGALVIDGTQIISVVTKSVSNKNHIINADHLTKKVLKLIEEVIESLAKDSDGKKISKIDYILSSPWIFSKLKTVKIDYKEETLITTKTLENIINEELESNKTGADTHPIEQKVFEIKLNGYSSTNFVNKKAHSLEVSLSTSFSSKSFLDKVNSIVEKHIHIKRSALHSALLLQYGALREVLNNKNEFIYIHIHSELSDVIIVKDGLCKYMASFPFGINNLLRKVASITKESIESSDSSLSLYQGNKLNEKERALFQKKLDPLMQGWGYSCIESFKKIFDVTSVPRTIYLSAHSHFDLFKEALAKYNEFNFEIIPYDTLEINNQISFEKGVEKSNMMKMYAGTLSDVI